MIISHWINPPSLCFSFSLCLFSFFRFCVGDKFFLKNNMILCQTDYEEGLMKEGYAPQVRWPLHGTFACGDRAERGPERGHAVRHQKHYHPLQPLSLIMYIRKAHYGALLYRIAIETFVSAEGGFASPPEQSDAGLGYCCGSFEMILLLPCP